MKIIVVDGDPDFARNLSEWLQCEGYESLTFSTVAEARQGLADLEDPVLVLLEHDFGQGEQGYELCHWLRENHPFGLLLPIIYLTGHETPDHFLRQQSLNPFTHPTAFVAKAQLAEDADLLSRILKRYQEQCEHVRRLAELQSARQALLSLADMDPDFDAS